MKIVSVDVDYEFKSYIIILTFRIVLVGTVYVVRKQHMHVLVMILSIANVFNLLHYYN